ncbi:MAG: hypothetical protein DRZ80_02260 [Thermoprotei archaeon]|nr:MAG: hypothetical protein DRZ80_02260 [Thermoprotei archaeon]
MAETPKLIERVKREVTMLSRSRIALLASNGQIIYSELTGELENLAKDELTRSFRYWGIGDYFVKHYGRENLIVGKVSDNLALVISSVEKTGLLILAFTTIEKKFKDSFKEVENKLKIPKTEKVRVKTAMEKRQVEKTILEPSSRPSREAKVEVFEVSLSPWTVLEPPTSTQISTVTMDRDMIMLLRLVDGWKTVEDLSKEAGIPLDIAIQKLSYLLSKGVVKSKYDEPIYQKKPKLLGKVKVEAVFMSFGAALGKARSLDDILKLVDGKRTILEIARELNARPEVLKRLFENLERRKILELK